MGDEVTSKAEENKNKKNLISEIKKNLNFKKVYNERTDLNDIPEVNMRINKDINKHFRRASLKEAEFV